jgi:hypothetical protein
MRRLLAAMVLFAGVVSAQVLTDASAVKAGKFAIEFAPVYYPSNLTFFTSGTVGISRISDIRVTAGFPQSGTYFGISNKWNLARSYGPEFSISYGAHKRGSLFGADGTLNLSFKLSMTARLYVGIDSDWDFKSGTTINPIWGYAGITDEISETVDYFLEAEPAINSAAYHIYSVGIRIAF